MKDDFQGNKYSQKKLDCDNLPEILCQDHEIDDAQVYHSGHHKGLDLL